MAPHFKLFVFIKGLSCSSPFPVTIEGSECVHDLKRAILKEKPNDLKGIDADRLTLYKVDLPDGEDLELEQLTSRAVKEELSDPDLELSEVFPMSPQKYTVSILVEVPNVSVVGKKRRREASQDDGHIGELNKFMDHSPFVQERPSTVARPAAFTIHQQEDRKGRILNDLPSKDIHITPIALLYSPFGEFLDHIHDCPEEADDVDLTKLEAAVNCLASAVCQHLYPPLLWCDQVFGALDAIFECYLPSQLPEIKVPSFLDRPTHGHADGPAQVTEVIIELQDEFGSEATDPEILLTSYYARMHKERLRSEHHKDLYNKFLFPALGISITGSYIGFSALVLLDKPRFVGLTPLLSARSPSGDNLSRPALFQAFWAACVLRSRIHRDTQQMIDHPPAVPLRMRDLPYVHKIPVWPPNTNTGEQLEFSILEPVSQGEDPELWNENRFLYHAKMHDRLVMVKFTRRYCIKLHHFCAERGHAPKLLGYGTVPGGWQVVVMEIIPHRLPPGHFASTHWMRWKTDLTSLVEDFHKEGFIHGDLRDANLIAPAKEPERIILIDYDWGREPGAVVSFPTRLLHGDLTGGENMKSLLITKEHDIRVLSATLEKLRPSSSTSKLASN